MKDFKEGQIIQVQNIINKAYKVQDTVLGAFVSLISGETILCKKDMENLFELNKGLIDDLEALRARTAPTPREAEELLSEKPVGGPEDA